MIYKLRNACYLCWQYAIFVLNSQAGTNLAVLMCLSERRLANCKI